MFFFDQPSALVGVTELRTRLEEILKIARTSRVFLGKRQKPVAVILPIDQYQQMEEFLDHIEDAVLGYEAQERDKKTKLTDYLSLEEAEKKVMLKK